MGQAPLTGHEPVTLLLLQHLFPAWTITRDERGTWRAARRTVISAPDVDGLLDTLTRADPDAAQRAVSLLRETR